MLISEDLIWLEADLKSKEEAIETIAKIFQSAGKLNNLTAYIEAVYAREKEFSTNMGMGIGIPHAKTNAVKEAALAFVQLKNPIAWGEEAPVQGIFQIAVPDSKEDLHLKILAKLARKLIYEDFRAALFQAKSKTEVLTLIQEATGGIKE